jgi:ferredoxin
MTCLSTGYTSYLWLGKENIVRIIVDASRCIAAGQCVLKAPTVFDQDQDEGTVILLTERPAPEHREDARVAARVCPAQAITIVEDELA